MKKIVPILILALCLSGCSFFEDPAYRQINKSAEQLASEASSAFLNEDYRDAVKAYTDLKDWYPFSKYAILAELKIADSHFHLEEYPEAIQGYGEFEKLHPRNEAIPYVINQIGLCWFNQIRTIDRDHRPAQKALVQFKRLTEQFPKSEHAEKAEEMIGKCVGHLAAHEFYVAEFYFKAKEYKAALKRYEYIVKFYPNSLQHEMALERIPQARDLVAETE